MTQLVLTPEQAATVANSTELVFLVTNDGQSLGFVTPGPFTVEDAQTAIERCDYQGPCRTTAEVLERLRSQESSR